LMVAVFEPNGSRAFWIQLSAVEWGLLALVAVIKLHS